MHDYYNIGEGIVFIVVSMDDQPELDLYKLFYTQTSSSIRHTQSVRILNVNEYGEFICTW